MRSVVLGAALALTLSGCGLLPRPAYDSSPAGAMAHIPRDLGWHNCPVELWITGEIVAIDGAPRLRDDHGVAYDLVWGSDNSGGVDWGKRYRIGGKWFNPPTTFWACGGADAVIPQ